MSPQAKRAIKDKGPQPFLKWAGGKRQLLPRLLEHVPETFGRYHEPFLGGGALFFSLAHAGRIKHGSYLGDVNPRLIRTWCAVQMGVEEVIKALTEYRDGYTESGDDGRRRYFEVQRARPDIDTYPTIAVAAWMIFLNKTGYNGVYRVNKSGAFNVPHGRHKSVPNICDEKGLRAAAARPALG